MPKPTITLHDLRNQGEITPEWCREHGAVAGAVDCNWYSDARGGLIRLTWRNRTGALSGVLIEDEDGDLVAIGVSTIAQLAALLLAFGLAELEGE